MQQSIESESSFQGKSEGHRRDYIVANDFFAAWISDLPGFGLTPVVSFGDIPNKLRFRVGMVVATTL